MTHREKRQLYKDIVIALAPSAFKQYKVETDTPRGEETAKMIDYIARCLVSEAEDTLDDDDYANENGKNFN